jgi:hypothetical protein
MSHAWKQLGKNSTWTKKIRINKLKLLSFDPTARVSIASQLCQDSQLMAFAPVQLHLLNVQEKEKVWPSGSAGHGHELTAKAKLTALDCFLAGTAQLSMSMIAHGATLHLALGKFSRIFSPADAVALVAQHDTP